MFAWRGLDRGEARFDDDGEPSGTAGRPCLGALEAADLRRAAVVVVRWFGGTELGTGGLARAYAAAADQAAAGTPVRRVRRGRRVRVRHAYDDTGPVSSVLERSGAVRVAADWAGTATLELAVPEDEVDRLRRSLVEATSGRAEVEVRDGTVLVPLRG